MIRSRYTIYVSDFPSKGEHLFYNIRTQGLVVVDDALRRLVDSLPAEPSDRKTRKSLRELKKLGFLAPGPEQDRASLDAYFGELKIGPDSVQATVLTTYACNFACTYCVEQGVTAAVHMDAETAVETARFIVARARKQGAHSVFVSLYGGEPLMNLEALRIVLRETRSLAEEHGLEFGASMTTNGALLTPRLVDELAGYGLRGVKVTLDGDREHHNAKRPFRNGSGSFDVIMRNVEYAASRIDVDIGGNFDDENAASFPALLDYLSERGLASRLNRLNFKPISEVPADRARLHPNAELDCVYSRPETASTMVSLRRAIVDRGMPADPGIGVNLCGITLNGAHFTVDPKGMLYRCPAFVGHPEFAVGDIRGGETTTLTELDLWKRCADCAYIPLCGDGCMYGAYLRFGDPTRLNCQREYVEYVVRENLKAQYDESLRQPAPAAAGTP